MTTPLDAARALVRAGVARADELVPLAGKVPSRHGTPLRAWTTYRVRQRDLLHPAVTGVGLRLGRVVDVDCDCPEAVELASKFLPPTFTFGRPSVGRAHWLYVVAAPVVTMQVRDPLTGKMVVELRGVSRGGAPMQTMMPGSRHPSGEIVEVVDACALAAVEGDELVAKVGELAVAVLSARYGVRDADVLATVERTRAPSPEGNGGFLARAATSPSCRGSVLERAAAYVARMDPAISGAGGQRQLFKVAATLVARFGLGIGDAVWIMRSDWNLRCKPPWNDAELRRASINAARVGWRRPRDLLPG